MSLGYGIVAARGCTRLAIVLTAAALGSCGGGGGGGGEGPPAPTPPDLAGVWAGSWQGSDPSLGQVTGTWEVVINQGPSSASGPSVLFGDVDCMHGNMQTQAGNQTQVVGSLTRAPCPSVNWTLTALNVDSGSATGSWTNAGTGGAGTLTGNRVARLTGPRIHFMHPPGGRPGTIVTLVGESLSGLSGANGLEFGDVPQPVRLSASSTRIVAAVPAAAPTGAINVSTADGTALSPRLFSTNVTSPAASLGAQIGYAIEPAALAMSPDGRKLYVADRSSTGHFVSVLRAAGLRHLTSTDVVGGNPRSVVASPDGKRIYVAAAGLGVLIMDAAIVTLLDLIPLPIADGGRDNPQGLAISPDGSLLLVSDGSAAGRVTLFRTADKSNAGTLTMPAGVAPLGVAFSPDGTRFFVAEANLSAAAGTLGVYDVATGTLVDAEPVGVLPTAIAVSPQGGRVFVTNQSSNSVSLYDVAAMSTVVGTPTAVGTAPTGIAHGPDGTQVYVVNRDSNSISVLSAITGQVVGTVANVGQAPIAIAINPQGSTGYVGNIVIPGIREIGGTRTLNIALGGTGIGRVTSSPAGIDCGTNCQAQFVAGTSVTLTATAQSGSSFSRWSGDSGCSDGVTTLNTAILNCTAIFSSNTPPPSSSSSGDCFIATAAYGSPMAPEVDLLRKFRDRHLLTNAGGRSVVQFYYRHSPALAEGIRHNDNARAMVRAALWPVVWLVRDPAGALSILMLGMVALGGLVLRRSRHYSALSAPSG